MGISDKISNAAEDAVGSAKEKVGEATDNEDLKNEGKADQATAAVKDGVEKIKDKANEVIGKLTGKD